jgi:hypothetical protein
MGISRSGGITLGNGVDSVNGETGDITLTSSGGSIVITNPTADTINLEAVSGGSGTVTDVSVVTNNGFAGTVATSTSTPAITLTTTVTGIIKGDGTAMSAAVAGDFPTLNQNTTGSAATLTTGRTIAITGDLAYTSPSFDGSANITAAGTLATVNANVGSFGSATQVGTFTVNGKGLITAAGNTTITPAASSITGGQALTKADDTNVTLTLGGTPTTALLESASITAGWTGQLAVSRGGSGAGTLTGLLQGNGTSPFTAIINSSTVGQCLRVTGASTYAWGALDLADTDAITGDLPFANLTQGTARSVLGVTGNATADVASIQGTADQVLRVNSGGTALAFGQVNLASTNAVTGDLPFANVAQLSANSIAANATTGTADIAAIPVAANTVVGRVTGGNIDDISVAFGLSFDSTSLRINLDETKFEWRGDHSWRDNNVRYWNPGVSNQYYLRTSAIAAKREIILPLLTGDDTFVFQAHTQTLTNKTLTSPVIEGGTIGNTTPATIAKVDNLQLDGNTLSSTDTNGNILIRPNGTGGVRLGASATDYWNFASDGTMSPVNPTNVAPFKLGVDNYAFNVTGTFAGLFFRFAGTFLPGVAGYVFPDLFGGDIASVDFSANESWINTAYGFSGGVATPTQIVANTNDWALIANNAGQFLRISSDAARNVTGIVAPTTANRGVWKRLINVGSFNMSFTHQDAASTAANRMITSTAGTIVLPPNGQLDIWYDYVSTRWRISLMN